MSQRKSVNGRPSGTDSSDFSYRMVVDWRHQKVADGKSCLSSLILTQGFIHFVAVVLLFLSTIEGGTLDRLSVSSSRSFLLQLYLFGSSVAAIVSVACVLKSEKLIELIKGLSRWDDSKLEIFKIAIVSLGVVVQIIAFRVATSLLRNMAPPKRAS